MWTRRHFTPLLASRAFAFARAPHLVFVLGDHEYSGEQTMPLLAKSLERDYGFRCTICATVPDQNAETNLPGLEALPSADLAVFFLRWRRLPWEQLRHIDRYLRSGRPVFGFRTSSHSFNYPKGHELEAWNRYATEAFGAPPGWGGDGHTHFGHESSTVVSVAAARHPILQGMPKAEFPVRSWLYRVRPKWPPAGAEILLNGRAVNPNKPAEENPVAWTWKNKYGARAFFTTLGHPEDFRRPEVQRLTVQAMAWCLDRRVKWRGPIAMDVPYRGMVASKQAYFFGFLKSAPNRAQLSQEEATKLQAAHIAHLVAMGGHGNLVCAGPLAGGGDLRGVLIYKTATMAEALANANADPMVKAGQMVAEFFPWSGPAGIGDDYFRRLRASGGTYQPKMAKYHLLLTKPGSRFAGEAVAQGEYGEGAQRGDLLVFAERSAAERKSLEGDHVRVVLDWYVAAGVLPGR